MENTMGNALVVDDSKAARMIMRNILQQAGYEVREATNGSEALEELERFELTGTLVLADWNMPKMNGLELLKQIRARPELSQMKVIIVTTEAKIEHMILALSEGADEYLMKPFTKEMLMGRLELIGAVPPTDVSA
jgi:two-component system, chemotaxis family, chemotaxis protein CheY